MYKGCIDGEGWFSIERQVCSACIEHAWGVYGECTEGAWMLYRGEMEVVKRLYTRGM